MAKDDYRSGEITSRGERLFHERINAEIGPGHDGKFVVIDVDSGDYEVDSEDLTATLRLLKRQPGARTFAVRVGFPTAYRLGGRQTARSR